MCIQQIVYFHCWIKEAGAKTECSDRVSTQWTVCENWWVASKRHPSVFLCCSSEFASTHPSIHPLTWGRPRPVDQSGCSQMKEICSTLRGNTLPVLIGHFVDGFLLRCGFTAKCFDWRTAGNWATSPVWNRKESLYAEPMVCVHVCVCVCVRACVCVSCLLINRHSFWTKLPKSKPSRAAAVKRKKIVWVPKFWRLCFLVVSGACVPPH